MKTLGKKFLVLLLTICMVTPLLSQPALAADGLGAEDPGDAVVLPGLDEKSITVKPIGAGDTQPDLFDADVPTPYAFTEGTRVLRLRAYPLAMDPNGDTTVYFTNLFVEYEYSVSYPALGGFSLSHNQTINLMQWMQNTLKASDKYQDFLLAGWHIEADIWFYYSNPEYMIYRFKTSTAVSEDIKQNVSCTNCTYTFSRNFGYPTQNNINFMTDYYYMGFDGAFYYTSSAGYHLGTMFTAIVGFNSSNPTTPD